MRGINDVLLAGLVVAVADWCRRHGRHIRSGTPGQGTGHAVLLDLEGHGREEIFGGCRPLAHGGLVHQPVPGAARSRRARSRGGPGGRRRRSAVRSRSIKEQLRALPDNGLGYGLLRYLNPRDRRAACAPSPTPQIGFNYLGRFAAPAAADWAAGRPRPVGGGGDPAMALAHALEVNALTLDGREGPELRPPGHGRLRCSSEAAVRDLARGLVPGAGGAGAPWLGTGRWRAHAVRSAAGCAHAGRDRAAGEHGCADRGHPAAVAVAGGAAVPCAVRRAGAGCLYGAAGAGPGRAAGQRRAAGGGAGSGSPTCQPARGLPAREPEPAGADHPAAGDGALAPHRSVVAGRRQRMRSGSAASWPRTVPSASIWPRRRFFALR